MPDQVGLISHRSAHDTPETVRRLRKAVEQAGMTIFAGIDHGQNAIDAGMQLRPTWLLIFGNPRGGTLLMQIAQSAGIDLPLKVLVWEDENGSTWLTYNDTQWLAQRHCLGQPAEQTVAAISTGMQKLAAAATA